MTTATTPVTGTVEIWCLQLGWSMQRLYRARPSRITAPTELPERLPGLSRLSRLQRVEIDYGRAQSCLVLIAATLAWTAAQTPDITEIAAALVPFQAPTAGSSGALADDLVATYQRNVLQAHLALLTAVAADGATLAKAYNLGRALADTARPGQLQPDLQSGFDPNRLAQLRQDLTDLASVLPPHAGKAVAQSLTWWRDVVYVADTSPVGKERVSLVAGVPTDAPPFRHRSRRSTPRIADVTSTVDGTKLLEALPQTRRAVAGRPHRREEADRPAHRRRLPRRRAARRRQGAADRGSDGSRRTGRHGHRVRGDDGDPRRDPRGDRHLRQQ